MMLYELQKLNVALYKIFKCNYEWLVGRNGRWTSYGLF